MPSNGAAAAYQAMGLTTPGAVAASQAMTGDGLAGVPPVGNLGNIGGIPNIGGPPKPHHSSFLGGIAHAVVHDVGQAAHDIKSIPGGLIKVGGDVIHGRVGHLEQDAKGMWDASVQSIEHPLRDPFMTLMTVLPAASVAGRLADAGVELGRTGDIAAAAGRLKPGAEARLRFLKEGDTPTQLPASKQPLPRFYQHLHDKVVQHGLDTNPEGRIASYGTKRIGGAKAETARAVERAHGVIANQLDAAGQKVAKEAKKTGVPEQVLQDSLRLTSENTPPEMAAKYHLDQAAAHEAALPKAEQAVAQAYADGASADHINKLMADVATHESAIPASHEAAMRFQAVADHGVTQDVNGHMLIDATKFPETAKADAKIAEAQSKIEAVAKKHLGISEENLKQRINAPNRYRAGAKYVNPTDRRLGRVPPELHRQRAEVAALEIQHEQALAHAAGLAKDAVNKANMTSFDGVPEHAVIGEKLVAGPGKAHVAAGTTRAMPGGVTADQIGTKLSAARDVLQQMEAKHLAGIKPTGIVGGETAREGRNFLGHASSEPTAGQSPVARSVGPVVGDVRPFISKQAFRGENMANGIVPTDTIHMVARHARDMIRYLNTHAFREDVVKAGTRVKKSSRQILVRDSRVEDHAPITDAMRQELGQRASTTEPIQAAEGKSFMDFVHETFPGMQNPSLDAKAVGTEAPHGYVWVDKNVVGDMNRSDAPVGRFMHALDQVNAGITTATVYAKPGHVFTRYVTNAVTNIIQGSGALHETARSFSLWKTLNDTERRTAMALAGQRSFEALPAEGEGALAKAARAGSKRWAKYADSVFRFNSLAYEARKAGFGTPEAFKEFMAKAVNPHEFPSMNAAEHAKIDWVIKRSDRAAIAYDRLNPFEKRVASRYIWFYPWVKGSSAFLGHTLSEHPFKSAVLGGMAQQGKKDQFNILGAVPSYEEGLVPLGHGSNPMVTDLSTFNPFATAADATNYLIHGNEGGLTNMLSPAAGTLTELATGRNSLGQVPKGSRVVDALSNLVSPAPEAQVASALLHPPAAGNTKMFQHTWQAALERMLGGPGYPRKVNKSTLNSAVGLENSGR